MTAPVIADLGAATLFPYAPDGQFPITVEEDWLTDVQPAADGSEVRQACRSVGVRALTFTALFVTEAELLAVRDRWLNATVPLRFFVPLWPEFAMLAGLAGAVLSCDTTNRDFVAGGPAMLYRMSASGTDDTFELVTVDAFDASSVTLSGAPTGSFSGDGTCALIPVMTAWLDPPTVEELTVFAERMALTFREELPAIAGIDGTIVEDAAAVAATIALEQLEGVQPYTDVQMVWRAIVKDAGGVVIPLAPIAWTITPDAPTDPGVRFTVSPDEQTARLELTAGIADTNHTLEAVSGAASVSIGIVTSA